MNKALVTITYDDGRVNNYDIAFPLHKKHGVPATFAIIAGRTMGAKYWKRHMQPWQVVEVYNNGVEISSHSYYHNEKLTIINDEKLNYELLESKRALAGFCNGNEVKTICIPYSASDKRVIEEAKKHYKLIRVHGKKFNEIYTDDPVVYSYGLKNDTSYETVKSWIDSAIEKKKWLVLMLHGVVDSIQVAGKYDITKKMLNEILGYIKSKENKIRCLSFNDVLELRENAKKESDGVFPVDINDPGSYVLSEADGYMITYHRNSIDSEKRNKIVISFGGLPSKKTKTGFGTNFILKQGYDHIFVAQAPRSQYQHLSLEDFFKVVKPYVSEKDVYTYGSSLGGYAAIYYGGIIDAKVISAAPKNSAHESMRKKSFSHVEFLHSEYKDNPKSSYCPVVLYDPYREEESKFIQNHVLKAYPNAKLIKLPFAGHTVLHTMKESGVLTNFIKSYVENGILESFCLEEEHSYIWNAEVGRNYFLNKDFDSALPYYKKSFSIKINAEAAKGLLNIYHRWGAHQHLYEIANTYRAEVGSMKGIPKSLLEKIGLPA